jgi:hypothetical protein
MKDEFYDSVYIKIIQCFFFLFNASSILYKRMTLNRFMETGYEHRTHID